MLTQGEKLWPVFVACVPVSFSLLKRTMREIMKTKLTCFALFFALF